MTRKPDDPDTTGQRVAREIENFGTDSTVGMPHATPELVAQGLSQMQAGGTLDLPASDRVESAGDLAPGNVIGHFVIRSRLGEGGMGVVLAGHDADLGRPVAIKVVKESADHPGYRARLLREAQVMARIEHPNVVRVHEVGSDRGRLFVAMEFIDGVTLSTWLKVQRRRWREIIAMFEQVGRGLAAVHAVGLVHRDFKPDNVLVDRDGRAKVADFGLARLDPDRTSAPELGASLTRTGMLVGTPAYMAPEQHFGGDVDARADQYSFCIALREALIGHRPAKIEDAHWGDVPRALRAVIDRGCSVDVTERHASMDALLDALARGASRRALVFGVAAASVVVAGGIVVAIAMASSSTSKVESPVIAAPVVADAPVVDAAVALVLDDSAVVVAAPADAMPALDAAIVVAPGDAAVVVAKTDKRGDKTAPRPAAGSATASATNVGGTVIESMAPVAETAAAKKHNLEGDKAKLHEMLPAHRAPVRVALQNIGFFALTITGDDRDGDRKELEAKLAASTDDLERGIIMYAMGQNERLRDRCGEANKLWLEARKLVLSTTTGPITNEKRRDQAFQFYGRTRVAEALCELEGGRAIGVYEKLSHGNANMWASSATERAEVLFAEGIALWSTGEHERGKEILLLAGKRGSDKLRKTIETYATAVGVSW